MTSPLAGLTVGRGQPVARPPRRLRTASTLAVLLTAAIALAVWLLWERLTPPLVVPVATVAVGGPAEQPVGGGQVVARATGWLQPNPHAVVVSTQHAGMVASIAVRSGQEVEAGDLVATLDMHHADQAIRQAEAIIDRAAATQVRAEAEVAVAKAQLARAQASHRRLLRAESATSAEAVEQIQLEIAIRTSEVEVAIAVAAEAETAYAAALIARDAVQIELDHHTITAPMTGIILRVTAVPGQILSVDDADTARIAEIFDPTQMLVRADIALADAGRVRPGQRAEVECDLVPGRILEGRVEGLAGLADATRNTVPVYIALVEPPAGARPDMLARVRILGEADPKPTQTTSTAVTLLVPEAALRNEAGGGLSAWIIDADQRLRQRTLTGAGSKRDGWVPIASGLHPGDLVVLGPVDGLRDGRRASPTFVTGP